MRFFDEKDVVDNLRWHNLAKLWNHAKKLLRHRWPDSEPAPLLASEAVINELHQSDPNGQTFRHEPDKDGHRHDYKQMPDKISPAQSAETINGVLNFLGATSCELSETLSYQLAAKRDAYEY